MMMILKKISNIYYGWLIVAALFLSMAIGIGTRQGFGIFIDIWESEWEVSVSSLSLAASIGWLVNGLAAPIVGQLSDRYGPKIILIFSALTVSISSILIATSFNIITLSIYYGFLLSFATATGGPVGILLSKWFAKRRGLALGAVMAGGSIGSLFFIPLLTFISLSFSWQLAWIIIGLFGFIVVFPLFIIVLKNDPSELKNVPIDSTDEFSMNDIEEGPLWVDEWPKAYNSKPMWQLSIGYFVCGITTASISVHFINWAISENISPSEAAFSFGVLSAVNGISVFCSGYFSDKFERRYILSMVYFVRGIAFISLLLLSGQIALWAFAIIGGLSWLATVPLTTALTSEIYGYKKLGSLVGLINMSHQIGGAAAVILFGIVFDYYGNYDLGLWVGVITLLIASIASFTINERKFSSRFYDKNANQLN
jgi:MFS family permease|tara:strand:- start:10074 stop:11348 length:1275 start_codon:yes stop_codon:yes gene_type:complete